MNLLFCSYEREYQCLRSDRGGDHGYNPTFDFFSFFSFLVSYLRKAVVGPNNGTPIVFDGRIIAASKFYDIRDQYQLSCCDADDILKAK